LRIPVLPAADPLAARPDALIGVRKQTVVSRPAGRAQPLITVGKHPALPQPGASTILAG
jgi:hypothetical protein